MKDPLSPTLPRISGTHTNRRKNSASSFQRRFRSSRSPGKGIITPPSQSRSRRSCSSSISASSSTQRAPDIADQVYARHQKKKRGHSKRPADCRHQIAFHWDAGSHPVPPDRAKACPPIQNKRNQKGPPQIRRRLSEGRDSPQVCLCGTLHSSELVVGHPWPDLLQAGRSMHGLFQLH